MNPPTKRAKVDTELPAQAQWGVYLDDLCEAVDQEKMFDDITALCGVPNWARKISSSSLQSTNPIRLKKEGKKVDLMNGNENAAAHPLYAMSSKIEIRDTKECGKGVFAKTDIKARTIILVEKPLVSVLDVEYQDEEWACNESSDSIALSRALVQRPETHQLLRDFHPLEFSDIAAEDSDGEEENRILSDIWRDVQIDPKEADRLKAVVKLNSLGFYTNCEQICHAYVYRGFTGTGLNFIGSRINHSCDPNVLRFSIGDATFFVVNRDVCADDELCISYIENEFLTCETSQRSSLLNRDFTCQCAKCIAEPEIRDDENDEEKMYMEEVDSELLAELNIMEPLRRVEYIEQEIFGSSEIGWIAGKDAQELRVVQAIACMQASHLERATSYWRRCAAFSMTYCPPFEESLTVYATYIALCYLEANNEKEARRYCKIALGSLLSGPFKKRMAREVDNAVKVSENTKTKFFDMVDEFVGFTPDQDELIELWHFKGEELPPPEEPQF